MRLPRLPVPASRRARRARAGGVRSTALRGAGSRGKDRGPAHGHPLEPAQRSLLGDTAGVSEAIASVPLEAAPPLAEASAPSELEARRALNTEYLRHHPEEVARFLDERMPSETALIVRDAGPEEAVHLLERLNPRVAADVLRHRPAEAAKIALRQMHPARAAPIVASFDTTEREGVLSRLPRRFASEVRELLTYPFDTAGALMDPRITAFAPETTVDDALRKMRTFKEKELGAIYLTDASGRLVGSVPLGEIATATPDTKLKDLVQGAPVGVHATATREEIVNYLTEQRVVAGQSGNSGMQALAVTMRGLALREVRLSHWPRLIVKEAGVGMLNGVAVAGTTMVGVFIWSQSIGLTVVIGSAMVLAMVMAGVSGAAIPLILKAFGQDPAQSSSIVLTTITDCSSFLSFLGLATILLRFL